MSTLLLFVVVDALLEDAANDFRTYESGAAFSARAHYSLAKAVREDAEATLGAWRALWGVP